MKLRIVPASQGSQWVKLGVQTFFKQPFALSCLFALYMAFMFVLSLVPVVGTALTLITLPAFTLGMMAATEQASRGQFPLPAVLLSAVRAGKERLQAMLVLGILLAAGVHLAMGMVSLIDGGKLGQLMLGGAAPTPEALQDTGLLLARLLLMALMLPLSMAFWHAPALVHWHHMSPIKSLFFSWMACKRNFMAYVVHSLLWAGVYLGSVIAAMIVVMLVFGVQSPETMVPVVQMVLMPLSLLLNTMFVASMYFTFRDSFETPPEETP